MTAATDRQSAISTPRLAPPAAMLIPCVSCAHMVLAPDGEQGNCRMGHLLALREPERFPTRSVLLRPSPLLRRVSAGCVDREPINLEVTPWL